jgi:hypothetical protein
VIVSDSKYRHRGYQDGGSYGSGGSSSSGGSRPHTPRPDPRPQRIEGAPRGRTAGGFGPEAFKCNQCGQLRHSIDELTAEETCQKCAADLHTCGNCRFFDTTTTWECRENIPARVANKHARNECVSFAAKIVRDLAADKGGRLQTPDDARKAFDALFKK